MDQLTLLMGPHKTREEGVCVMEAVAWFAGEPHTDAPHCACPVIAAFARYLNDSLNDDCRQRLKPLIPALALSRADWPITLKRSFVAANYALRVFAPIELEARGRRVDADGLRKLYPIVDRESARRGCAAAAALGVHSAATAGHAAATAVDDAAAALSGQAAIEAAVYATYATADAAAYPTYAAADASMHSRRLADLGIACLERTLAVCNVHAYRPPCQRA